MNRKIGKALVVGAGISGIRAALDLAEYGYGVTMIDQTPHIGGILSQLDYLPVLSAQRPVSRKHRHSACHRNNFR